MRIGRSNNRSLQTANNQGLARRVDNRIDATVDAYAARFKTALAVDGAVAFIFNKHNGIIPCTCRGFVNLDNIISTEVGVTGNETSDGAVSTRFDNKTTTAVSFNQPNRVKQVGGLRPADLDDFFRSRTESIVDKISNKISEEDGKDFDDSTFVNDSAEDIMDVLFSGEDLPRYSTEGDGDPMQRILSATNIGGSPDYATSSNFIACPICMGSGYVDTWRLYNGERVLLDASEAHNVEILNDVEIDTDSRPAVYSIYPRSTIKWTGVKFPSSWRHLMRLAVFNKGKEISPNDYRMFYVHPLQPEVLNPLTYQTFQLLNNSMLLTNKNELTIILQSNIEDPKYPVIFSHIEFVFSLGYPVRIQVPDMEVANEDEFVDWNLSTNFEMPADVELKENSYIVEGKYTRTWKVTQVNRKLTARGKSAGYAVGVRALHSFERQFFLFNILGKPRDPFSNQGISKMDEDDI